MFQKDQTGKARAAGASENRHTEQTPKKCFRCGSQDHLIAKFPKPPKDNNKWRKQVHFNEKGNRAYDNGKDNGNQYIYASTARMFGNDNFPREKFW